MTNDDITVIMIIKNLNLATDQSTTEYVSWTRDTTLEFLMNINNTTVSGVQTTSLMVYYGSNSISYTIPSASRYNNKIIQIGFRKRGSEAKLYFIGSNFVTLNNFTYSIPTASQRNLVFGNKAQVDINEAYIFNRAITDYEMDMSVLRLLYKYEIKYKPLRVYLPTGTSDVVKTYYSDNLPYFKSPAPSLLNMNNFRITNLLAPINANDANNMTWVYSQRFLKSQLAANLEAGAKIISNLMAPVALNDAVNMTWVNSQGFLKSPLTSNLDAGAKFITNLATPIALSDVATKSYVYSKAKNHQFVVQCKYF